MKTLLLIASLFFGSTLCLSAQSLVTRSLGNPSGLVTDENTPLFGYIDVFNETGVDQEINTRYEVIYQEPSEMEFRFSWGLHYDVGTVESLFYQPVAAGDSLLHGFNIETFLQGYEGHYTSPESGATIIRQFFYGADDQFITYKDVSYCLGIDDTSECDLFNSLSEIDSNDSFISNAYPNPSNGSVKFDYTISSVNESRIVILNSLGAEIERIELQESNGTASFSTDLLSNGIYTCLLHTNGNIVQSSRFIVD